MVTKLGRPSDLAREVVAMMPSGSFCCVCGVRDARALVDVVLVGGGRATLCGSHALMHRRSRAQPRSESELRRLVSERRSRRDRRDIGDELGEALASAFSGERRQQERRRA